MLRQDFDECQCCDNPIIDYNIDGLRVCKNCGLVVGNCYISSEKRAYTHEEVQKRRRTEPRWRNYGPRTVIDRNSPDGNGNSITGRNRAFFNRLSKIQGSLVNSLERNYWEARPKIQQLSSRLNVPEHIVETSWKIYTEVAKQKLTMGRSIDGFTTASVYAAIRIHNFPRLLEEIAEVAMMPLRSIHRSLGLIVREVFPVLHLKYSPISPEPLVFRFGNDLDLSVHVQKEASNILTLAIRHGLRKMGKDPKGLAAAALYMAAKPTSERMTQRAIAKAAHITEVTLRTRAKQIQGRI